MIISVQFKGKKSGTYGGMKFSYYCNFSVKPGDFVRVPTKYGDAIVKVAEVDVPTSRIEDSILAVMKTAIEIAEDPDAGLQKIECEKCIELCAIGEGDHICNVDPHKMPVSDYQPTGDYLWCRGKHFSRL